MLSATAYPFGGHNHETENKFLQPEVWLDEIQLFADKIGQKVVKVPANCHHNKEHGVFMEKGERHLFPEEIIVHLIKQSFACAPLVIKLNNFETGHFSVVCHYCPIGKIIPGE